jgi:hypothetical protein
MNRVSRAIVLGVLLAEVAFGQVEPRSRTGHDTAAPAAPLSARDSASPAPRRLYEHNLNFYEFVLRQLNPNDKDWGGWYEERRSALVDAALHDPCFWYCLGLTLACLCCVAAVLKSQSDQDRQYDIMGERMDEVRSSAACSFELALEAIEMYNTHIELCNRAIEASGSGHLAVSSGNSAAASPQAEPTGAKDQAGSFDGDKRRLEAEVAQKSAVIAELSLRVDALSSQLGGNGHGAAPRDISTASPSDLVRHINTLQQQLHVEREKNKRLKGGA